MKKVQITLNQAQHTYKGKLAYVEGWSSITLNLVLFALKYVVGIATGSVAILADAWHTLSDSLTSLVVLIGTKASAKPEDREHPFGHGRAELVASIIIGVLLCVVAFNFLLDAINKLRNHIPASFDTFAIVVFAVSVVLKEAMARFSIWASKKTGMKSLRADGWHHRSDAIASLVIVIGILVGRYAWWIDGAMGVVVALLIMYAAYDILRDAINPLIGETPDEKLLAQIRSASVDVSTSGVDVHHVHLHRYGNHTELTMHIVLPGTMSLDESHSIAERMETLIRSRLSMEATVHVEPKSVGVVGHANQET